MYDEEVIKIYLDLQQKADEAKAHIERPEQSGESADYHRGVQYGFEVSAAKLDEILNASLGTSRLQDNCLKLARIYRDFGTFLNAVLPQMTSERQEFYSLMLNFMTQTSGALSIFAINAESDDQSISEQTLAEIEGMYEMLKSQTLAALRSDRTIH